MVIGDNSANRSPQFGLAVKGETLLSANSSIMIQYGYGTAQ